MQDKGVRIKQELYYFMHVLSIRKRSESKSQCKEFSFTEPYLARSRDKDSKYNTIISAKDTGKIIISNENK